MRVIFDVGANDGHSGFAFAEQNRSTPVIGFEPTPQLVDKIAREAVERGLSNYEIVPKAVGPRPGKMKFNVAGQSDWGTSSLLEFNDNLENTWPGRSDFKVTHTIDVDVIRLDDFIEQRGITSIQYLHCDTQGTDLDVLSSLGKYISIVEGGVVETATSRGVALYKGQHTMTETILFLLQHGFEIDRMFTNQPQFNEVDVYYRRR